MSETTENVGLRTISTIYLVDDSDDEAFLTQMMFEVEQIVPKLLHVQQLDSISELDIDGVEFDAATSIVVIDLNLRSTRGTDVLKVIRSSPDGADVIAGISTGSHDPADRRDAFAAGADFCVDKPLGRPALKHICDAVDRLSLSSDGDGPLSISVVG